MTAELEEILMREKEKQDFYRKMLGKKYIKYYYTKILMKTIMHY